MSKVIKYDTELQTRLLAGIEKATDLVSTTMGPVASNVVIASKFGSPRITKDGITVIDAVEFDDKVENAAARLLREASSKTNVQSGDGTTGTAVLLRSIYKNGLKHTSMGGNKIQIRNGILKAAKKAVEIVKASAVDISEKKDIRNVAKISSNQSDEIADVLADVFEKIGTRGVIKVEEGNTTETVSTIVDGCQYDVGYISPYFSTNDKMEADLDSPYVVLCSKKLSNFQELLPLLQSLANAGKPLFIMCEDLEGEALTTVMVNRLRGMPICVVKSPSYGDNREAILGDLGILTGAAVVSESTGCKIENAVLGTPYVGQAKRIIVTKDTTTIIGNPQFKDAIDAHVKSLDIQIDSETDQWRKEKLEERRAKLVGGVAVISVGGNTQSEIKEKKDLVDDAFNAVKAALKDGIVAGGGSALLKVLSKFDNWKENNLIPGLVGDEQIGVSIFCSALADPAFTIFTNAGLSGEVIVQKILDKMSENNADFGYDVLSGQYVNMVESGIIDPASVIISEIENAASIAGLLLTSSGAIIDLPDKNQDVQPQMQQPAFM